MTFEQAWQFLLIAPPVLWMIVASYRSRTAGRFDLNIFGILLLLACGITGFALRKSDGAVEAFSQALTGLSDTDLKRGKRRIFYVIATNNRKEI